jgi:N-methylhydantoinase B/oxoprolinase/acetone carboxylase alpha subunit
MSTTEIKTNLHKIVDRIDDERLLRVIHDFLEVTTEQQQEVLQAYEDSENDSNLIDDEDVWRKLK